MTMEDGDEIEWERLVESTMYACVHPCMLIKYTPSSIRSIIGKGRGGDLIPLYHCLVTVVCASGLYICI